MLLLIWSIALQGRTARRVYVSYMCYAEKYPAGLANIRDCFHLMHMHKHRSASLHNTRYQRLHTDSNSRCVTRCQRGVAVLLFWTRSNFLPTLPCRMQHACIRAFGAPSQRRGEKNRRFWVFRRVPRGNAISWLLLHASRVKLASVVAGEIQHGGHRAKFGRPRYRAMPPERSRRPLRRQ